MATVIENFNVGNRTVLVLDKFDNDFREVEVDGIVYKADVVYEIKNAILIIGNKDFKGKTVALK